MVACTPVSKPHTEKYHKLTNQELGQMKVLDELKKKEERTDRIKAEVKALDYGGCVISVRSSALSVLHLAIFYSDSCALPPTDIQKIEAKVADESKRLDLAATIYHDFTRTRDAKDEKVLREQVPPLVRVLIIPSSSPTC